MNEKTLPWLAAVALLCIAAAEHHMLRAEKLAAAHAARTTNRVANPPYNALVALDRAQRARTAGNDGGGDPLVMSARQADFPEQAERPTADRSPYTAGGMPTGYVPGQHLADEGTYDNRRFAGRSVRNFDE
jgi:hypothetical protein